MIIERNMPNLKELYLGDNNIGPDGVKMLTEGDWKDLEVLSLGIL
jgi:hypothetical protein